MEHTGTIDAVGDVGDVAGFRLVRRIGIGSRSEVYLGRATPVPETTVPGTTVTAALKLFRADADGRAVDRQVRALLAVPPRTLARLTDVATTPDGRACLVLERLAGMSLAGLLAGRGQIGPGEVVTIVATVTTALNALHEAGFSHSGVSPACVRFDASGRPVLLGLGALEDLPAGAAGTARRRDDLVRLAGFARSVIDYLDHRAPEAGGTDAVLAAFEAAATRRPVPTDLTGLEASLFTWAPAAAVGGAVPGAATDAGEEAQPNEVPAGVPSRRVAGPRTVAEPTRNRRGTVSAPAHWWAEQMDRVRSVTARVTAAGHRARTVVARTVVARAVRPVSAGGPSRRGRLPAKPVAVALGLTVLLVTGALMLPSGTEGSVRGGSRTAESADPSPAAGNKEPVAAPSLQADDPAAAVLDLLQLRRDCLAEASVVCLDGVDQPGSVAMATDSYLVRQAQATDSSADPREEAAVPSLAATVQERTGNAALVVLGDAGGQAAQNPQPAPNTQPASALVIKGEAGWRLRELFDY